MLQFKIIERDRDFEARELTTGLWEAGKTSEQALGKLVVSLAAAGKVGLDRPRTGAGTIQVDIKR